MAAIFLHWLSPPCSPTSSFRSRAAPLLSTSLNSYILWSRSPVETGTLTRAATSAIDCILSGGTGSSRNRMSNCSSRRPTAMASDGPSLRCTSTATSTSGPTASRTAPTCSVTSLTSRAISPVGVLRRERVNLDRRVSGPHSFGRVAHRLVPVPGHAQRAHPDLIAVLAAHQRVRRGAVVLARYVPQRNVHGAYGRAYRRAPEVAVPVQVQRVMVYGQRVFAHPVGGEPLHHLRRGWKLRPEGRLAYAADAGVGLHLHQHPVLGNDRLYALDSHTDLQ